MHSLKDKVVIVTGASSGIGAAAAGLFAQEGARVVLNARRAQALAQIAAEIEGKGGRVAVHAGDVREEETAAALVTLALERFGGLDAAFNNAGDLGVLGPAHTLAGADWRATLEANLTSAFLCARHQIPALIERGRGALVFTSTFVGSTVGFPGTAAYAAAKAGVAGLVKVLAAELGPLGIRANALLSGGVDTPMGAVIANTAEARTMVEQLHALKRIADPIEIARAARFLLSDEASFVTGATILVDGGVSITRT